MINEFETMLKEVVVAYFEALHSHLPHRTEENHQKP
jgi:hypothetical protein